MQTKKLEVQSGLAALWDAVARAAASPEHLLPAAGPSTPSPGGRRYRRTDNCPMFGHIGTAFAVLLKC